MATRKTPVKGKRGKKPTTRRKVAKPPVLRAKSPLRKATIRLPEPGEQGRARLRSLGGSPVPRASVETLVRRLGLPPAWAELYIRYPVAGARLSLESEHDESGIGVELQFMDAAQMLSEAFHTYPGIVAVPRGYVPFGMCLEGSGDPYFLRKRDGGIVRIPHDAAGSGSLDEARIEQVTASLGELLERAAIG